eukprot:5028679-Prymnesium_polylepis.2
MPLASDCLFGLVWPGQALLQTAYPSGDFTEDAVFSDYLLDGVELLAPRTTVLGTVHSEASHGCFSPEGTNGDRFYSRPPDPPEPKGNRGTYLTIIVVLGSVVGGSLLLGSLLLGRYAVKRYRAAVAAKLELERSNKSRVQTAVKQVQTLLYPFCVTKYSDFSSWGLLLPHEDVRNVGQLLMFDTWELACAFAQSNRILFVSHQWLGRDYPDPNNVHYPVIVEAAKAICTAFGISETELYVWVDYSSIPQLCKASLSSAVASLSVYIAMCKYFLICTPEAQHTDRKIPVNGATYLRRGWCRFEQWARLTTGGLQDMYIFRSHQLEMLSAEPAWVAESINVFTGEFNNEGDMKELVNLVLGLWGFAVLGLSNTDVEPLKQQVLKNRETVFPTKHFRGLVEVLEREISDHASEFNRSDVALKFRESSRQLSSVYLTQPQPLPDTGPPALITARVYRV